MMTSLFGPLNVSVFSMFVVTGSVGTGQNSGEELVSFLIRKSYEVTLTLTTAIEKNKLGRYLWVRRKIFFSH